MDGAVSPRIFIDPALPSSVQRVLQQMLETCGATPTPHAQDAAIQINAQTLQPPVRLASLAARIAQSASALPLAEGWVLQQASRTLQHASLPPVHLTERECDLLCHLFAASGTGISQEALMQQVWHYEAEVQSHTLETHIYRLRQKLEALSPAPCRIETVDGGYCLKL